MLGLAHIPFEKLTKIQQKVGMKEFHKNFRRKNEANEVVDDDDEGELESREPAQKSDRNGGDSIKKAKGVKRLPKDKKELKRGSKNK